MPEFEPKSCAGAHLLPALGAEALPRLVLEIFFGINIANCRGSTRRDGPLLTMNRNNALRSLLRTSCRDFCPFRSSQTKKTLWNLFGARDTGPPKAYEGPPTPREAFGHTWSDPYRYHAFATGHHRRSGTLRWIPACMIVSRRMEIDN